MGSESYAAAGLRSSNVIDARRVFENKRLEVGDLPIGMNRCSCPHCICNKLVRRRDGRTRCNSCDQSLHLQTPRSPWELETMARYGLIECVGHHNDYFNDKRYQIECGCIHDPCGCPCHE